MRILLLEPNLVPTSPAGAQMMHLADQLSKRHDVSVAAVRVDPRLVNKVKVYALPHPRHRSGALATRELGHAYAAFLGSLTGPDGRFDIVHGVDPSVKLPKGFTAGAGIVSHYFCASRVSKIFHEGGIRYRGRNARLFFHFNIAKRIVLSLNRTREEAACRDDARYWIGVSDGILSDLQRYYGHSECASVIYSAVDHSAFMGLAELRGPTRTELGVTDHDTIVLIVAHGDWARKGLFPTLLAWRAISPNVKLVVVGGGDLKSIRRDIWRYGLKDRVILAGFAQDPRRFYAAADMLIHPSYFEAMPLVPMEAAAAGLPIISTRVNGIVDWLIDGVSGFYITHQPDDIRARVEQLAQDDGLRRRMAIAARSAVARFTFEKMAHQHELLYSSLLEK